MTDTAQKAVPVFYYYLKAKEIQQRSCSKTPKVYFKTEVLVNIDNICRYLCSGF